MSDPYPFRFYGAGPTQYIDDQLAYELAFTALPSAEKKAELAREVARATVDGHLAWGGRWLWADRFALFVLDNLAPGVLRHFRDEVPGLLQAIHAITPLEQVVFLGAVEATDPWTRWSIESRAEPTVGPRWGAYASSWTFSGRFCRNYPHDRLEILTPEDDVFEATFDRVCNELEDARRNEPPPPPPVPTADPNEALEPKEAAKRLRDFLRGFLASRRGFLDAWSDAGDEDGAALCVLNATAFKNEPKISVVFECAPDLEPNDEPVTGWIAECIDAAKGAHPNVFAAAEIIVRCFQADEPLDEP